MRKLKLSQAVLIVVGVHLSACSSDDSKTPVTNVAPETEEAQVGAAIPEEAPMDVRTPNTPIMPKADYKTIKFVKASSEITPGVRESLDAVVEEFENQGPIYLTLRMSDDDAIDATGPTQQFEDLTPERVTVIKNYLQQNGVMIEKVAVDESGTVADVGEDAAMARADETADEDAQYLVLTVTTNGSPEPSASIPH